jgi:iron complex transport system substrate-binding protein
LKAAAGAIAIALWVWTAASSANARPLRVMALDQCADQYVLALRPEADLVLSPRADDPDAWLRQAAEGRRRMRPTLEAAVGFNPDVVVRYWGGEPRLLRRLDATGATVSTLADAADFEGVRANIRLVARDLGVPARGEALIARMDARLAEGGAASTSGPRPGALYLTAGGFTAGKGTLVDAILKSAGYRNLATAPYFGVVSVERVALFPPVRFILGFFDQARGDWRGAGRHPVVRRAARGRVAARLPAAVLTCPAWFAADAVAMLKADRP